MKGTTGELSTTCRRGAIELWVGIVARVLVHNEDSSTRIQILMRRE